MIKKYLRKRAVSFSKRKIVLCHSFSVLSFMNCLRSQNAYSKGSESASSSSTIVNPMNLRLAASILVAICVMPVTTHGLASNHLEARAVRTRGDLDINDLHIFQSETDANNAVMVLTVIINVDETQSSDYFVIQSNGLTALCKHSDNF